MQSMKVDTQELWLIHSTFVVPIHGYSLMVVLVLNRVFCVKSEEDKSCH